MFPAYTHVDPYRRPIPHRMDPNSYPCQYHPGWEAMPPQMKAESLKHPSVFASYPFSDNMCPPNSGDHGGCCHHNYSPGYYNVRPQFSHVQPTPQLYYHGPYPPYPAPYPAYFVPPLHYPVDQARYDYAKAHDHCCGCPNHTCRRRDDSSPKIEEQKPEHEPDRESSGLIRLPNYPSPAVWDPTSSLKGREGDKAARLQPGCWDGWMPLDINSLHGSRQEDEGKEGRQNDDMWSQKRSPFPIIWMPGCEKSAAQVKDLKDSTPKSVEDWPSNIKVVPLKLLESGNNGEMPKAYHEEPKSPVQADAPMQKESKIKTIPVKQIEEGTPEKQKMNDDNKTGIIIEKPKGESMVKKTSEKKDSSPVRSSKLPPVCLRVDPLPRRKTNGTSRSLSPPGNKEKINHHQAEEQSHSREAREDVSEKVIPVVNEQGSARCQPNKEHKGQESASVASLKDSSKESSVHVNDSRDERLKADDAIGGGKIGEKDSNEKMSDGETVSKQETVVANGHTESSGSEEVKEKKCMKRDLSQTDASLIIQSAYRGYEVRRWRPLEKLRKIAKVRQQAGNVRRQIQSTEDSSKLLDAKERMVIGETIMSLLLELDTVQGLHPSVREARKSVARELVCLQEELDLLVGRIAEEHKTVNADVETKTADEAGFDVSCADEHQSSKGEYVEVETKTTNEAALVSGADEHQSSKGEYLDDETNSTGAAVTEAEAAKFNGKHTDPLSIEVVDVVSSSGSTEPATEQGSVQSAEDISGEAGLAFGNQEADISDAGAAIVAKPPLASEPVPDQGTEISFSNELLSGSVKPANENGVSVSKLATFEATTKVEGPPTGSDGPASAPLLVGNGPCEGESSSNTLLCEEVGRVSPGEASHSLDVEDTVEPLGESKCQEQGEAPILDEPCSQTSEHSDNVGQKALLLAHGAGEENRSEAELVSSLKQIEETDHNAEEEAPMQVPVEGDDHIKMSSLAEDGDSKDVLEADTVKVTMPENLAGVSVIRDVEPPVDNNAVKEDGVEHDTVAGQETDAHVLDEGSPAPEAEATSEEAPELNGGEREGHGLGRASAEMNGMEKKLVEENEKLREMLERLLDAGKEQLGVMSELSGRVRDLERKMAQRKRKIKVKRSRTAKPLPAEVVSRR